MKGLRILALLGIFLLVGKGWHFLKEGFSLLRVSPQGAASFLPPTSPPHQEVRAALSQPYHYLARGRQCFAFLSEDGAYVLKLPRWDRYRVSFRTKTLLGTRKKRERAFLDKKSRFDLFTKSCYLAASELAQETGVLYLQLGYCEDALPIEDVRDRLGRSYRIPSSRATYVLQKYHPLVSEVFQASMEEGKEIEAKALLEKWLDFLVRLASKGIGNKDPTFLANFGIGDEVVQIDIGSFYRRQDGQKSFREVVGPMQLWIQEMYPSLSSWMEEACLAKQGEL